MSLERPDCRNYAEPIAGVPISSLTIGHRRRHASRPEVSMAASRRSVRSRPRRAEAPADSVVACWEDDPGDPKSQPPSAPITAPAPQPAAAPLPFKIAGPVPKPVVAEPG